MITFDDLRVFLHVLAASVWVGGQIVLAGLVPTVRSLGEGAAARVAQAYARVAWPAFALLVFTGVWNLLLAPMGAIPHPEFEIKMAFVLLSGGGAALHQFARGNKVLLALGGAAASLFAVLALLWGVAIGQFV